MHPLLPNAPLFSSHLSPFRPLPQTRAAASMPARASFSARTFPAPLFAWCPERPRPPCSCAPPGPEPPPRAASSLPCTVAPRYPAPLRAGSSAHATCSRGRTWTGPRVVGAAVPDLSARLIAEAARGPAGRAGRVTARAAAAQRGAALPGPERARRSPCPRHRGHGGQSERQRQDRRRAARGHSRAQAGDRRPTGTDPKRPAPLWGGGSWPDPSPDPPPTCHGTVIHPHSSYKNFARLEAVKISR